MDEITEQLERDVTELPTVEINPNQHCTSEECPYTFSHTAKWCGYTQTRQCDCHWDYPERGQVQRRPMSERTNRKDSAGRELVDCDWEDCVAVDDPQTPEEYQLAYEHWREHNFLSGCSHGAV